jgi:hypothetical protein
MQASNRVIVLKLGLLDKPIAIKRAKEVEEKSQN